MSSLYKTSHISPLLRNLQWSPMLLRGNADLQQALQGPPVGHSSFLVDSELPRSSPLVCLYQNRPSQLWYPTLLLCHLPDVPDPQLGLHDHPWYSYPELRSHSTGVCDLHTDYACRQWAVPSSAGMRVLKEKGLCLVGPQMYPGCLVPGALGARVHLRTRGADEWVTHDKLSSVLPLLTQSDDVRRVLVRTGV